MLRIKRNIVLIAVIIFILLTLCIQTIPKMQYYSKMKQSNLVELETLVKEYPNYPEAYILLGEKYSPLIPEKAAFNYKKAVEIVNNKNFEAAMDEYTASAYLKNGNAVGAVKYYSNPILVKFNLTTNILLANILQTMGRYDESIYVLDSFEKNDFLSIASAEPDMFSRLRLELWYNILSSFDDGTYAKNMILHAKAIVYYEKADYENALFYLNEFMKNSNNIPISLLLRIYTAIGDLDKAEKYCNLLNKYEKSQNFMDSYSLALYYLKIKDYKKSEDILKDMVNSSNRNLTSDKLSKALYGFYGLGILNLEKGDYKSAIKYLSKALEYRPYYYNAVVKLAECYKKTNDLKNYNKYNLKIKALLTY